MLTKLRSYRPSHATIVAYLALFIALGGSSYAALRLPRNSVGPKQIRSNAVTSPKVKNGSLLSRDFAAGQLPSGAQGPRGDTGSQGQKGDTGPRGPSDGYYQGACTPAVTNTSDSAPCTATLHLPQGTYLVYGKGSGENDSAADQVTCLVHSPDSQNLSDYGHGYAATGKQATATVEGAVVIGASGGTVVNDCYSQSGTAGTLIFRNIISAIKVGTLHASDLGLP